MLKWLRGPDTPGPPAPPYDVRAAREAAGWTVEQAADAMGVLPAELAAWESGGLSEYESALMRWRLDCALYDARLPRFDCEWARASAARREWLRSLHPSSADRVARVERAHARECAECARVQAQLRDLPPPPSPPAEPGPGGWMTAARQRVAGLPGHLRDAFEAAALGLLLAAGGGFVAVVDGARDGGNGVSLRSIALISAAVAWGAFLLRRTRPLLEQRPHLGGQLIAAGLVVPGMAALGLLDPVDVSGPGPWIGTAGLVGGRRVAGRGAGGLHRPAGPVLETLSAPGERPRVSHLPVDAT